MDYTVVVNGTMKPRLLLLVGLLLALASASCGSRATPPTTPDTVSAPTDRAPAVSRVSSSALPPICRCVLRFDRIGSEQGLSQSSVRVIFQDHLGFLWFGTEDGLNRYDGYTFKTYKPDPDVANSLSDRWVTSIVEDRDGYLWIATLGGLNRYDPQRQEFSHYLHDDANPGSLSDNHVNVLYLDKSGSLWVGTANGLDLFDRQTNGFKHYAYQPSKPEGISGKYITAIYQDSRGRFWVGTASGGLNLFDPSNSTFTPYQSIPNNASTISNNYVTAIIEDSQSTLWVGTREGLDRFDPDSGNFERFLHSDTDPQTVAGRTITDLFLDSTG